MLDIERHILFSRNASEESVKTKIILSLLAQLGNRGVLRMQTFYREFLLMGGAFIIALLFLPGTAAGSDNPSPGERTESVNFSEPMGDTLGQKPAQVTIGEIDEASFSGLTEKFPITGPLHPFVNVNQINRIFENGTRLFFVSEDGMIQYDMVTKDWQYHSIPEVKNIRIRAAPWRDYYATGLEYPLAKQLPHWVPLGTYTSIVYADSVTDPNWVLTALAGEGAVSSEQNLVDLKNRRVFQFPFEEIKTFHVTDDLVWLGSGLGIISLDPITGERIDYVTYPAYRSIEDVHETPEKIYYLSGDYGVFSIDKASGTIEPLEKLNSAAEKHAVSLRSMYQYDGRLLAIGVQMDSVGRFLTGENVYIYLYREATGYLGEFKGKISYADAIYDAGDALIIYGARTEWYEGGDVSYFGGAILMDKKTHATPVLTESPVVSVSQKVTMIELKSMTDDNVWTCNLSKIDRTVKPEPDEKKVLAVRLGIPIYNITPKVEVCSKTSAPDDIAKSTMAVIADDYKPGYVEHKETKSLQAEKIDAMSLKKIRVRFQPISIHKGKVKVLQF